MKNILIKIVTVTSVLAAFLLPTAFAGAVVVVTLNTGDQYTWQFEDFEDASDFFADRVESGRCSPKVANIEIKSVYIDGLDDPDYAFNYFHGINKYSKESS